MANKSVGLLTIAFGADTRGFDRAMKKAQKNIKKFGNQMNSIGRSLSRNLTLPMAAFAAASVKAFDTQIKAETKLLTALKGKEAVQKRLIEQAQALQKITLFGDEETIAAQAMLATMGLEEEAIMRLIPLVQDMAVAKGMNLVQAADLVAKSVGSSTNALSRYGIEIVGAVGSSERLNSATAALTQMFQGQAEAVAKQGLGAWQQLQNTLGDVSEEFGKIILQNVEPLNQKLSIMVGKLKDLTKAQKENIIQWSAYAAVIGPLLIVLAAIVKSFGTLLPFLLKASKFIFRFANGILRVLGPGGRLAVVLASIGKGLFEMVTGERELTELEKNLSKPFEATADAIKDAKKELTGFDLSMDMILGKTKKNFRFFEHKGVAPKKSTSTSTSTIPTAPSGKESQMSMIVDPIYWEQMSPVPKWISEPIYWTQELTAAQEEYNKTLESFKYAFADAMSSALVSQDKFFKSFLANLKQAIIKQLIMSATTNIIDRAFTGGIGGIGGLLKGIVGGGLGNITSGGGSMPSSLQRMSNPNQQIQVFGRLSGNDIFLSNQGAGNSRARSV